MVYLDNLLNLDYTFNGQPFCEGAMSSVTLNNMDYSLNAQPFVRPVKTSGAVVSQIKKFIGVAQASIKTAINVPIAQVKKIISISNV